MPDPLMRASFDNCIVYGMASDINVPDLEGSSVFFRYTLFRSSGADDDNFLNCLWDQDPLFYTDRPKYIFNYRVRPDSPAIGAGDAAYVLPACRRDMDGNGQARGWRAYPGCIPVRGSSRGKSMSALSATGSSLCFSLLGLYPQCVGNKSVPVHVDK